MVIMIVWIGRMKLPRTVVVVSLDNLYVLRSFAQFKSHFEIITQILAWAYKLSFYLFSNFLLCIDIHIQILLLQDCVYMNEF